MKFMLNLKETHYMFIEQLKEKHSITSNEEIVKKYVKSALNLQNNDLIFATEREKCSGGCYASEPKFEINLQEDDFNKLKKIYKEYNFEKYDTEEEEISKTIRCILNFIENEPDLISIKT